ncbi:glycosyltransferase [Paraconexibacter sp. AEG42_29]|uniref:Glycosyltransferase n=1 Tax=Paraconexibacter sp. AEG42_29 TaxID=2997339 RepID=A0AAU7B327_9ACTN
MRVLIDTTFALRGPSGTGVYLARLIDALQPLGVEVVEAQNTARRAPAGGGWRSALNAGTDAWWTTVALPARAAAVQADVIHHPLPAYAPRTRTPQVVTVHDLAFERVPECFDPAFRRWASITHRTAARHADAVVAVSHTTAMDVRARWGVPEERIVVARHGPGQEVDASRPRGGASHLLYIGDDEPRKNLGLLLAAHRLLRADVLTAAGTDAETAADRNAAPPLVLAGTARPPVGHPRANDGIHVVDRPEPETLAALLNDAIALVLPSLHEGFGLTAVEAMAAGVPVIAARSPGLTETCGDAALYVDPYDPQDLAATIRRVTSDRALRADLTERGRRQAAELSWVRAARAHVRAYNLAADG